MIVGIALVLSFLIKTFLFRAFFIPSTSMEDDAGGGRPDLRQPAGAPAVRAHPRRRGGLPGRSQLAARRTGANAQANLVPAVPHLRGPAAGLSRSSIWSSASSAWAGTRWSAATRTAGSRSTANRWTSHRTGARLGQHTDSLRRDRARGQGLGDGRQPQPFRGLARAPDESSKGFVDVGIRRGQGQRHRLAAGPDRLPRATIPRCSRRSATFPATRPDRAGSIPGRQDPSDTKDPTLRFERSFAAAGHRLVAGADEVGRGALAGPVSVGMVVVDATLGPSTLRACATASCSPRPSG